MSIILRLISWLGGSAFLKTVIARVLVHLGMSTVTYYSVATVLDMVKEKMALGVSGLPAAALTFLTLCKFPNALNVIFSAWAGALAVSGLTAAGALRKIYKLGDGPGFVFKD